MLSTIACFTAQRLDDKFGIRHRLPDGFTAYAHHADLRRTGRRLAALRTRTAQHAVSRGALLWGVSRVDGGPSASFHLVLEGTCRLHLPAQNGRAAQSTRLVAGDAVFPMHDMAHCLTPTRRPTTNTPSVSAP
ncbi:cupin domain-containing protein [Paraburkholderia xenovorans]|uniref:cupin domain-containing protein n=1 Tax=Paraburkholderia xenovorans TaxID=36873 RepID=UPI001C12E9D3